MLNQIILDEEVVVVVVVLVPALRVVGDHLVGTLPGMDLDPELLGQGRERGRLAAARRSGQEEQRGGTLSENFNLTI